MSSDCRSGSEGSADASADDESDDDDGSDSGADDKVGGWDACSGRGQLISLDKIRMSEAMSVLLRTSTKALARLL